MPLTCVQIIKIPDFDGGPSQGEEGVTIIDFINEVYNHDAVDYTIADAVSNPELRTASGLVIPANTEIVIELLAPFNEFLLAGQFTVVVQVETHVAPNHNNEQIFRIANQPTESIPERFHGLTVQDGGGNAFCETDTPSSTGSSVSFIGSTAAGIHRVGMTLISTKISASLNGGTVVDDTYTAGDFSTVGGKVSIGGSWGTGEFTADSFALRKMKIWQTPQSDVDLPGLQP